MRAFGATIFSATFAVCAAASMAHAQGQISDIRFGKQPDAERIVLDLSADPVDATQTSTDERFVLEMGATKPQLSLDKEDRLADMKIFFEDAPGGSRLVVEKRNRPVSVFRILAAPGSGKGDRLVVDVGRTGGGELVIPKDAARVPEVRGTSTAKAAAPKPPPAPEPVPEPEVATPDPTPEPAPTPAPAPREQPKPQRKPEDDLLGGVAPSRGPDVASSKPPAPAPAPLPPRETSPSKEELTEQAPAPGEGGDKEDVWVLVRAIEIQGVSGDAPSLQDLQELKLAVSPVRGGFVAPRDNAPVQRLPLRALVGDDRNGRRLSGSVLQLIVETIAAEYTRNEKLGTRVDIRRTDLEGLIQGGEGRLVIRVREMPARAAGSAEN